jgi:hypothetical protein
MFSLDIIKKNFYSQDNLFTQEIMNEIVSLYMSESGPVTLFFDKNLEEKILNILVDKENVDINNLKALDLTSDEWVT